MVAARDLTLRLGSELARAAAMAARLEQTMDFGGPRDRSQDLRILQDLDLLTQTLSDLTRFTVAVAPLVPEGQIDPSPALDTLLLRGVAHRLSGEAEPTLDRASGDLALF